MSAESKVEKQNKASGEFVVFYALLLAYGQSVNVRYIAKRLMLLLHVFIVFIDVAL